MEMIKITFPERSYGFGKPTSCSFLGVRFDNGKIAFLDRDEEIRGYEGEAKLLKEYPGATIAPHESGANEIAVS